METEKVTCGECRYHVHTWLCFYPASNRHVCGEPPRSAVILCPKHDSSLEAKLAEALRELLRVFRHSLPTGSVIEVDELLTAYDRKGKP